MSETTDTKNHPTVKALREHQERIEANDTLFARRYLGISPASWSLLKSGIYPAQNPAPMLERCESALQLLNDESAKVDAGGEQAKIVSLLPIRAALKAVKDCYGEPQNRLVVYLADTGGGKTTLARKLRETYLSGAICGEATETWRSSYFNAAATVAEWVGLTEKFTNPREVEAALLDKLAVTPRILVVDEAHYCGPQALNLVKAILNRTPTRVVLLSIPELWQRMAEKAYKEVQQLRRRTAAKIVVGITHEDCRLFLTDKLTGFANLAKAEAGEIVSAACAAASFGLYDTIERICAETKREAGSRGANLELVKAAIKRVKELQS